MVECIDHGRKGMGRGYATAWVVRDGHKRSTTLHRKVYFEKSGEWPEVVRHTCDNPRCINPAHLIGGTYRDNMADMRERHRSGDCRNFGECNGRATLSDEAVKEVRALYQKHSREYGTVALARRFGCGSSPIHRIVKGAQRHA